jgi:hypothetical protein
MANNYQNCEWDPMSFYLSQLSSIASEGFDPAGPFDSMLPVSIDLQARESIAERVL